MDCVYSLILLYMKDVHVSICVLCKVCMCAVYGVFKYMWCIMNNMCECSVCIGWDTCLGTRHLCRQASLTL